MKINKSVRWHFVIFLILSVIAVAQLTWWVIYQVQEGSRITMNQESLWAQQIQLANEKMAAINRDKSADAQTWLAGVFPDLEVSADGMTIGVTAKAIEDLDDLAQKRVRMFVSEGAFFSLLVLAGVWFMYWTLRKKVQLENQTASLIAAASQGLKEPIMVLQEDLARLAGDELSATRKAEIIANMKNQVSKISSTRNRVSMIQLLTASKRNVKLSLVDLSEMTMRFVNDSKGLFDNSGFIAAINVEPGLSTATNPERWLFIAQGVLDIGMLNPYGDKRIEIELRRKTNKASFSVRRENMLASGKEAGDKSVNAEEFVAKRVEPDFSILQATAEMIGGKASISSTNDGKGLLATFELPLLEGEIASVS